MHIAKERRPLAREAERQHWTITETRGHHLVWRSPSGRKVFSPSTPSEHRGLENTRHQLRKAGLKFKKGH